MAITVPVFRVHLSAQNGPCCEVWRSLKKASGFENVQWLAEMVSVPLDTNIQVSLGLSIRSRTRRLKEALNNS